MPSTTIKLGRAASTEGWTMRGWSKNRGLGLVLVVGVVNGCVPHVDEQQIQQASGPSLRLPERRVVIVTRGSVQSGADPVITTSLEGNVLRVKLEQPMECREVVRTPMEERTKRTLSNGTLAQGTNLVAGGALLALGIAGFASIGSSCTKTPDATDQNPSPTSRPCTADEQTKQDNSNAAVGGISTGLALVPLGLFVWNIFRAKDGDSRSIAPTEEGADWSACGAAPASGVAVELQAGRGTLRAKADELGMASFDLTKIEDADAVARSGIVAVRLGDSIQRDVDVRAAPIVSTWKAGVDARSLAQDRQALADANARLAEQAEQDRAKGVVLGKLERWARAALSVKWSEQAHIDQHCFNRVETEVPCDGAAAFRKETNAYNETFALVHNRSAVSLVCSYDWGMPNGSSPVGGSGASTVAAGTQQKFKKTHPVVLSAPPVPRAVVCAGQLDAIAKEAGLPSDAARAFGGDGKRAIIGLHNDPKSKTESYLVGIDGKMFLRRGDGFEAIR